MISFGRFLVVALAAAVVGCATTEVAPGMEFNKARRTLYAQGWAQYDVYQRGLSRGDPQFTGVARRLRDVGLVEVEDCVDGTCTFNYRRGSLCTRLTTQGDELAKMRVTSVTDDCPGTR